METPYLSPEEQYTAGMIIANMKENTKPFISIEQRDTTKRLGELKLQSALKKQFTKGKDTNGNGHYNNITTSHNLTGEIR